MILSEVDDTFPPFLFGKQRCSTNGDVTTGKVPECHVKLPTQGRWENGDDLV